MTYLPPTMEKTKTQRLEDNLIFWQDQGAQNERDRKMIVKVCLGGLPVSCALAYFDWRLTAAGLGLFALIYLMGMYMTWVRRGEFIDSVREVQEELRELHN
jgi:hypothetical protein